LLRGENGVRNRLTKDARRKVCFEGDRNLGARVRKMKNPRGRMQENRKKVSSLGKIEAWGRKCAEVGGKVNLLWE